MRHCQPCKDLQSRRGDAAPRVCAAICRTPREMSRAERWPRHAFAEVRQAAAASHAASPNTRHRRRHYSHRATPYARRATLRRERCVAVRRMQSVEGSAAGRAMPPSGADSRTPARPPPRPPRGRAVTLEKDYRDGTVCVRRLLQRAEVVGDYRAAAVRSLSRVMPCVVLRSRIGTGRSR